MARKRTVEPTGELGLLVGLVRESYDRPAWHGPNLRAALRGVDARLAFWRPAAGRHNIWELALHTAFWHFAVAQRLSGERTSFDVRPRGRDWPAGPAAPVDATPEAWQADLALLARHHARLLDAAAALRPRDLHHPAAAHRQTPALLLRGVACHNLYHAGQIQMLRRLASA